MYLKELNLKGFKSFARKTVLKFEPGLTVIVGPNGSGKSNIADAVMWVLGEQSPSNLRGSRMEDVIFAGSSTHKPVNYAEVELVLDNSNNDFPLSYSEVSVSRSVVRGGESEYMLNSTPCRLADIQEILSDAGIGRTLNSVVSQGQLDEVLSMRPEERRRYIEEAGGLLKFRRRREKAARKLERTEDEILRVKDVLREVKRQIKPLSHQAKRFDAYREISQKLNKEKATLTVLRLREVLSQQETLEKMISTKRARLEWLTRQIEEISRRIETIDRESSSWRSRESSIRKAHHCLIAVHERLIAYSEKMLSEDSDDCHVLYTGLRALEDELKAIEKNIQFLNDERARINEKLKIALGFEEEKRGQMYECEEKLRGIAREVAYLEGRLEGLRRSLQPGLNGSFDPNAISSEDLNSLRIKEKNLSVEYEEIQASASRIEAELERALSELYSLRKKKSELVERIRENDSTVSSLLAKLEILSHLDDINWDFASAASELERNDSTGGGLSEMLARNIEIEEGYETAICGFLGPWLFGLKGEDEKAIIGAIEHLKKRGVGQALFFLPKYNDSDRNADVEQPCPEGLRRARDLVSAPEKFSGVLDILLGNVYVVSDIDEGFKYASRYPDFVFLTIESDVISGKGLIRGGSPEVSEAFRSLCRKRMEEREALAAAYLEELDQLELEQEALSFKEEELLTEIKTLYLELSETNAEKSVISSNLRMLREKISLASEGEHAGGNDSDARTMDVNELEQALNQLLNERKEQEQKYVELGNILKETQRTARELEGKVRGIDFEIVELEDRRSEIVRRLEAFLAEKESTLLPLKDKLFSLCEKLVNLAASKRHELESLLKEREMGANEEFNRVTELRRKVATLREEQESLKESLHKDEVSEAELKFRINQLSVELTEEHGISPDLALRQYSCDEPASLIESRISKLTSELERLGPVNPVAISDLEVLDERKRFLSEQLEDLEKGKSQLRKVIKEIDREIELRFGETFNLVDRNFREIFSLLFPGGSAELRLTDPEDVLNAGVEIFAQPEGKRLRRISLLSGGETALTAIAFFFALFKVRPSPFYFLDEVEAALDDVNLNRFLRLVKEFKNHSQLILITHQKRSMEIADVLYGVSMQGDGISRVISQRMDRSEENESNSIKVHAASQAIA